MNRDWHDMSLSELAAAIFANLSGDGDESGGRSPWTFVPGQGWTNPAVQVGGECFTNPNLFGGLDATADGTYYLNVDVAMNDFSISTTKGSGDSVFPVEIGTVYGGKQLAGIYSMPVIFAYK